MKLVLHLKDTSLQKQLRKKCDLKKQLKKTTFENSNQIMNLQKSVIKNKEINNTSFMRRKNVG